MQNLIKKFFGLCLLLSLFLSAAPVFAEGLSTNPAYLTSVSGVATSKTTYVQGDTVSGTFNLVNSGTENASDIYYRLSIAGGYDKNQIPSVIYDKSDLNGPLSVLAGKTLQVNFSYKIPADVAGSDMGIKIETLTKQGQLLGWANGLFTVTGNSSFIKVNAFSIGLGGKYFTPSTGPTVHEGESPIIIVDLTNTTKANVSLKPVIKVYNRVTTGDPLFVSTTTSMVTFAPGVKKSLKYDLPTFNKKAGVYAGTINFVDDKGTLRTATLEFRYIIDGDIATIQSINTGSGVSVKGQPINVSVLYSGKPRDTRLVPSQNSGEGILSVSLYNEKNELVGQSSSTVGIISEATKNFTVIANTDSRALRADAELSKDGKVLSKLSTSFSPSLDSLPPEQNNTAVPTNILTLVLAGLGFLVIVLILWLILKKHKTNIPPSVPPTNSMSYNPPKVTPPPSSAPTNVSQASRIPPAALLVMLIIGTTLIYSVNKVFAYSQVAGAPVISGSENVHTNDANAYFVTYATTTPNIRYAFSLNGDGNIDQYIPSANTWLNSNIQKTFFLTWLTSGSHTFAIKAIGGSDTASNPCGGLGGKLCLPNSGKTWSTPWQPFTVNVTDNPINPSTFVGAGGWKLVSYDSPNLSPNDISLSMIPSSGPFNVGDSFQMQFVIQALQCSNSDQKVYLTITSIEGIPNFVPRTVSVDNGYATGCTSHCAFQLTNSILSSGWLPVPATAGTYKVNFEIDVAYDAVNIIGGAHVIGYKNITVGATPQGFLEGVDCSHISGWACDLDSPSTSLSVHIYKDYPPGGAALGFVSAYTANVNRSDLSAACGGTTAHGFNVPTPAAFLDGKSHSVYAYAINVGTNGQPYANGYNPKLSLAPKTFDFGTCGSTPPPNQCTETTPAVPSNFTSSPVSCYSAPNFSQTHLTWTPVSNAASYKIKRATSASGAYTEITSRVTFEGPTANPTGFFDTTGDLTPGTTYYYKIISSNCAGDSAASAAVSAVSSTVCPLSCPSGQTAVNGVCTPIVSCPADQTDNGSGVCVCTDTSKVIDTTVGSPTYGQCITPGTISCKATTPGNQNPTSAKVGDLVTWVIDGNPGNNTYTWTGTDISTQTNTPSLSVHYATIGKKVMNVTFTQAGVTNTYICSTPSGGFPIYNSVIIIPN